MMEDSDYVEGEYIFEMQRLPKTAAEADRMAKKFLEEAARWVYDDDLVEEEDEVEPI